jgi:hypothetical protein
MQLIIQQVNLIFNMFLKFLMYCKSFLYAYIILLEFKQNCSSLCIFPFIFLSLFSHHPCRVELLLSFVFSLY